MDPGTLHKDEMTANCNQQIQTVANRDYAAEPQAGEYKFEDINSTLYASRNKEMVLVNKKQGGLQG